MSFTPFNAPLLGPLLGDKQSTEFFSVKADLNCMIAFEVALAKAQAKQGVIPQEAALAIENAAQSFEPNIAAIGQAISQDGVAVPEFVRQFRTHLGDEHSKQLHFGSTSQDLIDTSFILRIKDLCKILDSRLAMLDSKLESLAASFGSLELNARTRMQIAIPVTVGDRIAAWKRPLNDHRQRLDELLPRLLQLQLGGAAGTLDKMGEKGKAVSKELAALLGLNSPSRHWQTDRSAIGEFANWLSLVSGSLGKMGQDIALMAQNEIGEIALAGGGGSSAMPHKQNPVLAESLVSLARFNAVQLSGIHNGLVHEQERSGTAWTLEWMILPQMCIACSASTKNAITLLDNIRSMGKQQ